MEEYGEEIKPLQKKQAEHLIRSAIKEEVSKAIKDKRPETSKPVDGASTITAVISAIWCVLSRFLVNVSHI